VPWFPELSYGRQPNMNATGPIPFYDGILGVKPDALLGSWAGAPDVDDPRSGHVVGVDAFTTWVNQTREWLIGAGAVVRPVHLIVTASRTVEEVALDLTLDGVRRELPVAVVAERHGDGRLTAVRVYHSLWPLTGGHEVRHPLLARDPTLTMPDVVGGYQRALAAGNLDGILASYEDGAVVREPAGGEYTYTGKDALRRIYSLQFADGLGIPLEHCTLTDDGRACAVEYNAVRWGAVAIPAQAGIAVYQRGDSGKLAFARIYDDVAPPAASDSSTQGAVAP
jgi:hypothetical protein